MAVCLGAGIAPLPPPLLGSLAANAAVRALYVLACRPLAHRASLWVNRCFRAVGAIPLRPFPPLLRSGGSSSAVALVGLLHPLARVRHHARGSSRSRYARQSGWVIFYRLPHRPARPQSGGFPSVQLPEVFPPACVLDSPPDTDLICRLPP